MKYNDLVLCHKRRPWLKYDRFPRFCPNWNTTLREIALCGMRGQLWRSWAMSTLLASFSLTQKMLSVLVWILAFPEDDRSAWIFIWIHFRERFQNNAVLPKKLSVLVWTEGLNTSKCMRFQRKTHWCGQGLPLAFLSSTKWSFSWACCVIFGWSLKFIVALRCSPIASFF